MVVPEEDEQRIAAPAVDAVAEGETVHASGSAARTASSVAGGRHVLGERGDDGCLCGGRADVPLQQHGGAWRWSMRPVRPSRWRTSVSWTCRAGRWTPTAGVREDAFLQDLASQVTQARSGEDNLESTIGDNADADLLWLQGVGELPALAAGYGRREAAANHVTPQGTVEAAALDQSFAPMADDADQVEDR